MTELSPAAQAVLDAFLGDAENTGLQMDDLRENVAAALRAAADQAENVNPAKPSTEWGEGWQQGVKDVVAGFRRIADELENS